MSLPTKRVLQLAVVTGITAWGVALADAQAFVVTSQSRYVRWEYTDPYFDYTTGQTDAPDGGPFHVSDHNCTQDSLFGATSIIGAGSASATGSGAETRNKWLRVGYSSMDWRFTVTSPAPFSLVADINLSQVGAQYGYAYNSPQVRLSLIGPSVSFDTFYDQRLFDLGTRPPALSGVLQPGDYEFYARSAAGSSDGTANCSFNVTLSILPEPTSALGLLVCAALGLRRRTWSCG